MPRPCAGPPGEHSPALAPWVSPLATPAGALRVGGCLRHLGGKQGALMVVQAVPGLVVPLGCISNICAAAAQPVFVLDCGRCAGDWHTCWYARVARLQSMAAAWFRPEPHLHPPCLEPVAPTWLIHPPHAPLIPTAVRYLPVCPLPFLLPRSYHRTSPASSAPPSPLQDPPNRAAGHMPGVCLLLRGSPALPPPLLPVPGRWVILTRAVPAVAMLCRAD